MACHTPYRVGNWRPWRAAGGAIPATLVAVLLAGGTALAVQPFGETDFAAIIGDAHNNHFAGVPFATRSRS